jgi:drug/metabolite transporter (DMT)-like permease
MTEYLGELAALTTATLWSMTAVLFTLAGRHVPAWGVNLFRTWAASLFLAGTLWILSGRPWPQPTGWAAISDLALSGVVGLALGDTLLFQSYAWIGPRLATLLMSLAPVISAIMAGIALREHLAPRALLGMAMTLSGIAWVIRERPTGDLPNEAHNRRMRVRHWGVGFALAAAACQAGGAVLAKRGMLGVDPLPATLVRMVSAAAGMLLGSLLSGQLRRTLTGVREPRFLGLALAASILGPYLGVWLSLVSLKHTETAVALTLMALSPILVIPISARVFGERMSPRALLGAVVAVAGVAVLVGRG